MEIDWDKTLDPLVAKVIVAFAEERKVLYEAAREDLSKGLLEKMVAANRKADAALDGLVAKYEKEMGMHRILH
jgi:U3 small nucleolar RNA-associated protein 14